LKITDEAVKSSPDLIAQDTQPTVIQKKGGLFPLFFLGTQEAAGVQGIS
jgi:hypothetical protein